MALCGHTSSHSLAQRQWVTACLLQGAAAKAQALASQRIRKLRMGDKPFLQLRACTPQPQRKLRAQAAASGSDTLDDTKTC